jgi:hypothetical protein
MELFEVLVKLVNERPMRYFAEGRVVLHFDRDGLLRKIEDMHVYKEED